MIIDICYSTANRNELTLNENSRIAMAQHSRNMLRIGVNGMCGQVGQAGLDPTKEVFMGKNRRIIRLLQWERDGFTMYYGLLELNVISWGGAR